MVAAGPILAGELGRLIGAIAAGWHLGEVRRVCALPATRISAHLTAKLFCVSE
jgi:hypothetical protein